MYFVQLPSGMGVQRLSFYLATEEYLARSVEAEPLLFFWSVRPTVIFGRNQNMEAEVNVDYCRVHGIDMQRRKSGGGCVYADEGNMMICYIASGNDVRLTFSSYVALMLAALRKIGLPAEATGRNDITIGGRKVSGAAFYHIDTPDGRGRNIVHATMLYDTNFENMTHAITPPAQKLAAKGVESVRSRIALIKDFTDKSFAQVKVELRQLLCASSVYEISSDQLAAIRKIEGTYLDPAFVRGDDRRWSLRRSGRVEGCGDVELRFSLRHGTIESATIGGDYFAVGDVGEWLRHFCGQPMTTEGIASVVDEFPPDRVVRGLRGSDVVRIAMGGGEPD